MSQVRETRILDTELAAENRRMARWVLVLVLSFFSVIIAVNVFMAVVANRNWTGLVVKSAYVEGQVFNEKLAEARQQAALNWHSDFGYQGGTLSFSIFDDKGQSQAFQSATAKVGRPANEQSDMTLVFQPQGTGTLASAQVLEPGLWSISIEAISAQGQIYRRDLRLYVRDNGVGVLQ